MSTRSRCRMTQLGIGGLAKAFGTFLLRQPREYALLQVRDAVLDPLSRQLGGWSMGGQRVGKGGACLEPVFVSAAGSSSPLHWGCHRWSSWPCPVERLGRSWASSWSSQLGRSKQCMIPRRQSEPVTANHGQMHAMSWRRCIYQIGARKMQQSPGVGRLVGSWACSRVVARCLGRLHQRHGRMHQQRSGSARQL
jgi:hypothetical protein